MSYVVPFLRSTINKDLDKHGNMCAGVPVRLLWSRGDPAMHQAPLRYFSRLQAILGQAISPRLFSVLTSAR